MRIDLSPLTQHLLHPYRYEAKNAKGRIQPIQLTTCQKVATVAVAVSTLALCTIAALAAVGALIAGEAIAGGTLALASIATFYLITGIHKHRILSQYKPKPLPRPKPPFIPRPRPRTTPTPIDRTPSLPPDARKLGLPNFRKDYTMVCWLNSALQFLADNRDTFAELFDNPGNIPWDLDQGKSKRINEEYLPALQRVLKGEKTTSIAKEVTQLTKPTQTVSKEKAEKIKKLKEQLDALKPEIKKDINKLGLEDADKNYLFTTNRTTKDMITRIQTIQEKRQLAVKAKDALTSIVSSSPSDQIIAKLTRIKAIDDLINALNITPRHKKLGKFQQRLKKVIDQLVNSTNHTSPSCMQDKIYQRFVRSCKRVFKADDETVIGRDSRDAGEFILSALELLGFPVSSETSPAVVEAEVLKNNQLLFRRDLKKEPFLGAKIPEDFALLEVNGYDIPAQSFESLIQQKGPLEVPKKARKITTYAPTFLPDNLFIRLNRLSYVQDPVSGEFEQIKSHIAPEFSDKHEVELTEYAKESGEEGEITLIPKYSCTYTIRGAIKHNDASDHYTYHQRSKSGVGIEFNDSRVSAERDHDLSNAFKQGTIFWLELVEKKPFQKKITDKQSAVSLAVTTTAD